MTTVSDHYEAVLAAHYTWLYGGFDARRAEQSALFDALGLEAAEGAAALDLGCGSGFQAVPLAERGYRVLALDTSAALLAELEGRAGGLPVETRKGDIETDLAGLAPGYAVIVCMGDTLTHLSSKSAVAAMFAQAARLLAPGGALVLTWRDLSEELKGVDRFIPVRADADRVMLCFLEYGPETVSVHDLIHVRDGGGWTLAKGSYPKLRLGAAWVCDALRASGLAIARHETARGFTTILARRAA